MISNTQNLWFSVICIIGVFFGIYSKNDKFIFIFGGMFLGNALNELIENHNIHGDLKKMLDQKEES